MIFRGHLVFFVLMAKTLRWPGHITRDTIKNASESGRGNRMESCHKEDIVDGRCIV